MTNIGTKHTRSYTVYHGGLYGLVIINMSIIGTLNRIPTRGAVVIYTACHGATIVMKNSTILFHKNVALCATMVSDIRIAQTDITIVAP